MFEYITQSSNLEKLLISHKKINKIKLWGIEMKNKIQIIGYNILDINKIYGDELTLSSFSSPKSLDDYEITIIYLHGNNLWENNNHESYNNKITDLRNLYSMLLNSNKTKVIFLYPQDCYYWNGKNNYPLKNNLKLFEEKIKEIFDIDPIGLIFENTTTIINNNKINSNFYITESSFEYLSKSTSEKTTTINNSQYIITTLNIDSYEALLDFLREINFIEDKSETPVWFNDIKMFDDEKHEEIIKNDEEEIVKLEREITSSSNKLKKNNEYKSILYTNADELVDIVFDILEQILECDLSDFEDKGIDDFCIAKNDVTFIGEIKGIRTNVKNSNLAQVNVHAEKYKEKLEDEGKEEENIKEILIVNPLRKKDIRERESVDNEQISLAKNKYKSLIVTTENLLMAYEKYLEDDSTISSDKLIEMFRNKTGLFEIQ